MENFSRQGWLGLVVLLGCLLLGCGGGSGSGRASLLSGIQGQATRGPIAPTAQPGLSNEAPLPGVVIVVKQQNGAEVARQTTSAQGNFKIGVAPGVYQVVGLAPNGNSTPPTPPAPQTVTVAANQYATVNVSYDTGIR